MDLEDQYFYDSKENKKERKEKTARDRSKYKKTDIDKKVTPAKALQKDELRGRVLATMPGSILVESCDAEYECVLRGTLKQEKTKAKNLVAIGDFVHFLPSENSLGSITYVEERTSILSRAEHLHRKKEQIIAANVDQVLITCALFLPHLKPTLIDRYIIAAQKGNMQPILVINKVDLAKNPPDIVETSIEEEIALYQEIRNVYPQLGIPTIEVSAENKEGLEDLFAAMKDKTSVFSGQSGVGKSSLINCVIGSDLKVGSVIERTRKGSHTTSHATLLPLTGGGFCIDTPGIRSFGVWEVTPEDIQQYFPEIQEMGEHCRFRGCTHSHEPDCRVKEALESGSISKMRYESYISLIENKDLR